MRALACDHCGIIMRESERYDEPFSDEMDFCSERCNDLYRGRDIPNLRMPTFF